MLSIALSFIGLARTNMAYSMHSSLINIKHDTNTTYSQRVGSNWEELYYIFIDKTF